MFLAARALNVTGPHLLSLYTTKMDSLPVHRPGKGRPDQRMVRDADHGRRRRALARVDGTSKGMFILQSKPGEAEKVVKVLNNGGACISSNSSADLIASIINSAFERHLSIYAVGQGTLIALPKPKRPPGHPANLCPIASPDSGRKIISNVKLWAYLSRHSSCHFLKNTSLLFD